MHKLVLFRTREFRNARLERYKRYRDKVFIFESDIIRYDIFWPIVSKNNVASTVGAEQLVVST